MLPRFTWTEHKSMKLVFPKLNLIGLFKLKVQFDDQFDDKWKANSSSQIFVHHSGSLFDWKNKEGETRSSGGILIRLIKQYILWEFSVPKSFLELDPFKFLKKASFIFCTTVMKRSSSVLCYIYNTLLNEITKILWYND